MDDPNTATGTLDAEEDILTYTVSDDALEAAADIERVITSFVGCRSLLTPCDGPLSLSSRLGLDIPPLGYFDPRPRHQDRPQRPKVWPRDTLRNYWGFGSERIIRGYQTVE